MTVSLTPEMEDLVNQKVATGRYDSAAQVVANALRVLDEWERSQALRLDELHREINEGIEAAERGDLSPLDIHSIRTAGVRCQRK